MASFDAALYSLNVGEVSRLALARVDLAKLRVACEIQSNWLPHVLGPCMVRPGTRYLLSTAGDAEGWLGEFYFDETTKALLVITASTLQLLIADAFLARVAVTAAVANGNFTTDVASWTDADEAGGASVWATGGYLSLVGTGATYGFRDQQVTVNEIGTEHALRLVIERGYVSLKVGTSAGDGTYWALEGLAPGTYSLAFTPTGASFWIRLGANTIYPSLVDSINIESVGTVSLPVPYTTTAHLDTIRYDQSGDVIFVACAGFQQRRIERRASNSRSWAVVRYFADDGPFRLSNLGPITLTPSATTGSITLTASRSFFKAGHVEAIFRLTHSGQTASATLGAANVFTNPIRISGLASHNFSASSRSFAITVDGTFTATVTLQRSLGAIGSWTDVESYTAPTSKTFDDGLDNQIIFYRLGIKTGNYTSGSASAGLSYAGSSQSGIARITAITSDTVAAADVLAEFGSGDATDDWSEGDWSAYRGWPAALALHDGRLFWGHDITIHGSVSDAFHSFDDQVTGDSAPINRTIATGGLDGQRWLMSLQRLIAGTAAQEISIRADAFDGVLTPTAFVARVCGDAGSAKVRPSRLAKIGAYVGRSAKRLFKVVLDVSEGDYTSKAFDRLKPEMFAAGVRDLAVQRQPDNAQLWAPLADGTAVIVTHDPQEDVEAMVPFVTLGAVERVAVLPGSDEDDVYFIVHREIAGVHKRYIEKLAKRSECVGGTLSKTMDSHIVYSGAATTTLTGLGHLEGSEVVVWGRPAVTAAIANGTFTTDLASWTDADEAGAASVWAAGGYLTLTGTGTLYAYRDQAVAVTEIGTPHSLTIVVAFGYVVLRVGTVAGGSTYLERTLDAGTYEIPFTPTGATFWVRLGARTTYPSYVDSIAVTGVAGPQVTADAPKIVTAGQITGLPAALTDAVVGLAYTAQLKTVKLAYAAQHGTAMTMRKRVARVGLVMADVAWKGVRIGRDFAHMTGLPATYRGKALAAGQVLPAYDAEPASFNGGWDPDSRVCISVTSPYPCTVMGLAIEMTTNEPDDEGPPPAGAENKP